MRFKTRDGFTLIEMVVVMFIISMLLLLIVPHLEKSKQQATRQADAAFVQTLQTKVDMSPESPEKMTAAKLAEELTPNQVTKMKDLNITVDEGVVSSHAK